MRVLITGSHGLVGSALLPRLVDGGHSVRRLVRGDPGDDDSRWRPEQRELDPHALDGVDAVVHLAGAGIGDARWNAARKQAIRDSRVLGTELLCESIARASARPKTLVMASAVGFYGDRGDAWLDESSPLGAGFLADVCREWEWAARAAVDAGVRVVALRFGFVLSPHGGGLKKMLPPFRMGIGGRLGSGRQFMSWIALDDLLAAILHALRSETLRGAVNAVAPEPVTNAEFTRALGRVLHRPAALPMPSFMVRALFGEAADELLLASQRVKPARLLASEFTFAWPTLEPALRHLLAPAAAPVALASPAHA